jgi:hypothetical protein
LIVRFHRAVHLKRRSAVWPKCRLQFVALVAGRHACFSAQARTAGPIDKSLSVTTSPTKGVDHAGNGLLKAKQPFGRHRDHCQSTPAYHRGLNPLAVLPTPIPSGRHAAAPDLFLFDHLVGGVLFDRHPAHIRCADLSSDLEARENAFQCLHCFLFVQLL